MKIIRPLVKALCLASLALLIALPALSQSDQSELMTSTGWEFLRNGQHRDAVLEFEKALDLDPANSKAGEGLGSAAMQLQDWPKAKRGFEIAHKAHPDNCSVTANLAYVEMRLKHYGRAQKLYEDVVGGSGSSGCNPTDNYSRSQLASIYYRSKDSAVQDKAIQLFNQVLNTETENTGILFNANFYQGMLYKKRKAYDRAIELLEKAFEIMPEKINGRYDLGVLYFNGENYDKALEHLQVAYAQKSNDYNVNLMMGLCYYSMDGRDDDAVIYLQKAVNLVKLMKADDRPQKNLPHRQLADLYTTMGETRKAVKTAEAGLRVTLDESEKAGLTCMKAKAMETQGKFEDALELFESVMADPRWGSYARQQADRQEQLIQRAKDQQ